MAVAAALVLLSVGPALTSCTFGPGRVHRDDHHDVDDHDRAATTTTSTIPPTTTTSSTTTTSTTTIPPTTTSTTIPLITEGAVIIVANASGVTGGAALLTQELGALGFHLGEPTNGAGIEEKLDVSKVYFMPAGADVATSVGRGHGQHPRHPHAGARLDHRRAGEARRRHRRGHARQGPRRQQADRAGLNDQRQVSSSKRYPMPESVMKCLGRAPSTSSFLRMWAMWTRSRFGSGSYVGPHTAVISCR